MKKILFAATVLCMMGCQNKPTNSTPALDPSNMDTSVAPNESFYQYATGGWQAKNPLKPEHSSYNMFNVLSDNNEIRINELFTQMTKENPAKGTVNQKIADLYKLGLDSVRLNKEGAAPVKAELKTILSLDKKEQLTPILSVMQLTSSSPLFSFGPQADLKDSKVNALYIGQSGIGMGDRDYYLDAENESIREAYKTYLNRLFTLAGLEESEAGKATDAVMRIETELAKNMRSNVELRDIQRMYNPMTTADLKKNYDAIDWAQLFAFSGINPERVIVCQPEYMEALNKLIETTPIEDLRYYLASQYLNAAAPYLDDNFYAASFDFYGRTMSGKQEPRPRWKRAMAIPNSALGEAVEVLPRRGQGPHDDPGGESPHGPRPTHRPARLDERLDQDARPRETRRFPRKNRLPRQVEGLLHARNRPDPLLLGEYPACQRMGDPRCACQNG